MAKLSKKIKSWKKAFKAFKNRSCSERFFWCVKRTKKYINRKKKNGFTMIEMLVVLTILGSATTFGVMSVQSSLTKSRDAQRKSDLETIKVALENYYNDNRCYPQDAAFLQSCDQPFATYIPSVPCDPITREPYHYVPLSNACLGYRLHAGLENSDDPSIAALGCDTETGCGYGLGLNYGIAVGATVFDPDGVVAPLPSPSPSPTSSPVATPTPSPAPTPPPTGPVYVYACDSGGVCNQFEEGHPYLFNCPVTFPQSNCNNECGNPAFRCEG